MSALKADNAEELVRCLHQSCMTYLLAYIFYLPSSCSSILLLLFFFILIACFFLCWFKYIMQLVKETAASLKTICKALNLTVAGTKAVLVTKIMTAIE